MLLFVEVWFACDLRKEWNLVICIDFYSRLCISTSLHSKLNLNPFLHHVTSHIQSHAQVVALSHYSALGFAADERFESVVLFHWNNTIFPRCNFHVWTTGWGLSIVFHQASGCPVGGRVWTEEEEMEPHTRVVRFTWWRLPELDWAPWTLDLLFGSFCSPVGHKLNTSSEWRIFTFDLCISAPFDGYLCIPSRTITCLVACLKYLDRNHLEVLVTVMIKTSSRNTGESSEVGNW